MKTRIAFAAFTALLLTVAVPAAAAQAQPANDPVPSSIDIALLEDAFDHFAALGGHAAMIEVRDGDDVWSAADGSRFFHGGGSVRPTDEFRVGSVTKSMVTVLALQLETEGLIDLDLPVQHYDPDLLPYEEPITMRQLLSLTSGIPDYAGSLYGGIEHNDLTVLRKLPKYYSPETLIGLGTADVLKFEPGSAWDYSNTGYYVAALVMETRTGIELRELLRQRVFAPLDMKHTYLPRGKQSHLPGRGPVGHLVLRPDTYHKPYYTVHRMSFSQSWAAGGVVSTTADVNTFYRALFDGTLLEAEQLAAMTTPLPHASWYGLGLFLEQVECPDRSTVDVVGHHGGIAGFSTQSFHAADGERQVTLAWNRQDVDPDPVLAQAGAAVRAAALCG